MKYRYTSVNSSGDGIVRRIPLIKVKLEHQLRSISILAMIDSGADICVFNIGYAQALGIDLKLCEQALISGAEGGVTSCYKTMLTLEPEGLARITTSVLFIDSSGVDGLLGQEGFFDQHLVSFDRSANTFEVQAVSTGKTPS
jgi:hypothetical protein